MGRHCSSRVLSDLGDAFSLAWVFGFVSPRVESFYILDI